MKFLAYMVFPPSILKIPLNTKYIGYDGNDKRSYGNVGNADDECFSNISLLQRDDRNNDRVLNMTYVLSLIF